MHRQQLEHIIRAATGITGATEFVIIGSQAVLGQFPQAPDEFDAEVFIKEALLKPTRFTTWVDSKPWNFFMQDTETGETFGAY